MDSSVASFSFWVNVWFHVSLFQSSGWLEDIRSVDLDLIGLVRRFGERLAARSRNERRVLGGTCFQTGGRAPVWGG